MRRIDPQEYYEQELAKRQIDLANSQINASNMQVMDANQLNKEENENLVKQQLDLGKEINRIDKLLRGWTLIQTEKGEEWKKPDNEDLIILSDAGLHYFRQLITNYAHKGTILSNYDEETIQEKMRDLANQINDDIFLSYESFFMMPSLERCYEELKKRLSDRAKIRRFAYEILGKDVNEVEVNQQILQEMEMNLEREINQIRDKLFEDKLKRFSAYLLWVEDLIHSCYQRALKGEERRGLRRTININENRGGFEMPNDKKGILSWVRK